MSDPPPPPAARADLRYSYLVAVILAVVYTFNFLDRQFLTVLAEPVKRDLHLTDTQLGALTGLAFALFYTVCGVPVAALADRGRRVRIVTIAAVLWSLFSAGCGLAGNFATLALMRMGVGVGEAGGAPPSYAIISDYFPRERRATGLAIYSLGVPFGTLFGAASGGWIAAHYGWRAAFFAVGLSGLVITPLLMSLVKEPVRGGLDPPGAHPQAGSAGLATAIAAFVRDPVLTTSALSGGLTAFVGYAQLNWAPAFLIRDKHMSLQEIALYYSVVLGLAMGVGTLASGPIVDRLGRRSPAAYALFPAACNLLALPFAMGFIFAPDWRQALAWLVLPALLNVASLAPALAIVQNATPPARRSTAGALMLLVLNLLGLGGGPLFVGALSDRFARLGHPHDALKLALVSLAPVFVLASLSWCGVAGLIARRRSPRPA